MLRKITLSILPFLFVLLFTSEQFSDDGRAGYTGSPGENDCTSCHASFAVNTGGGSITLQIPGMSGNEYVAGQTYNLSVTIARSANNLFGFGFEALNSALDNAGNLIITDPASTQIKTRIVNTITKRNVVHQLNAGAASGSKTFNFDWTAPLSGSGPVTFYFAGVAADGNGNDNNDYVYKSSLTVNELICNAPVQPAAISGNQILCANSSYTYSIPVVNDATDYTWTLPVGWTGNSTSNSINVVAGTNSGNISVTANNACGSSVARILSVTSSNPVINISKTDVLCFGENNGTATAVVSGGISPYTYNWTTSPAQNTVSAINLSPGNYSVNVTDSIGCIKNSSINISEPANALSASAGSAQSSCEGTAMIIGGSPSAQGGTAPYDYLWTPGTGLSDELLPNPQAMPSNSITYHLHVTDANGCDAEDSVMINIKPAAPVSIQMINDTLFTSGTGTIQWLLNSVPLTGANDTLLIPASTGNYEVEMTYPNGCVVLSPPFHYTLQNIFDEEIFERIQIYPNPTSGIIHLSIPSGLLNGKLYVYDIRGSLALKSILAFELNKVDLINFHPGSYFFIIEQAGYQWKLPVHIVDN